MGSTIDGVHSLLSADKVDGVYKFAIGNIEGNPGTGIKKSQMASFDLAYIKFADELRNYLTKLEPILHQVNEPWMVTINQVRSGIGLAHFTYTIAP